MKDKISFNSNLVKYGMGLFETMKVVKGRVVFLEEHLDRLYSSLKTLELDFKINREVLEQKIVDFAADLDQEALRVTVCDEGYNFSTREIPYQQADYEEGYNLQISSIQRGNSPLYKHKTANYFNNLYARQKAKADGYDDTLFLDTDNFILETAVANIFFIKGDRLYTPTAKLSLLPGVIREQVLQIAQKLEIETKELVLEKPELTLFDSAFMTNSLVGLMRINKIESVEYQTENSIFKRLQRVLKNREMGS